MRCFDAFVVSLIVNANCVEVNQCLSREGTERTCVPRGTLDLAGFINLDSFHPSFILASPSDSFSTTELDFHGDVFSASIPVNYIHKSNESVEDIVVLIGRDNQPVGFSVTLKPALGSPLLRSAIVKTMSPSLAPGPIITMKDSAPLKNVEEAESTTETEPSFLRKYWWLIVGAMLISSVMGPSDAGSGQAVASSSSNPN